MILTIVRMTGEIRAHIFIDIGPTLQRKHRLWDTSGFMDSNKKRLVWRARKRETIYSFRDFQSLLSTSKPKRLCRRTVLYIARKEYEQFARKWRGPLRSYTHWRFLTLVTYAEITKTERSYYFYYFIMRNYW